jgi:chitodextrinase
VEGGESVTLDASESSEGSYPIEEYRWNVGGETLSGETTSTSFVEGGEKTIELEVVDSQGNTATETATVLVDAEAPEAAISVQADRLVVGEEITFSGEDSESGSSDIEDYQWTVNGESAFGESTRFVFEEPGNKTVELTVVDAQDRESTVSKTVAIIDDNSSDGRDDSGDDSDSGDGSGDDSGNGDDSDGEDGTDGSDDGQDGSDSGDDSSDGDQEDQQDDGDTDEEKGFFGRLWESFWTVLTFG